MLIVVSWVGEDMDYWRNIRRRLPINACSAQSEVLHLVCLSGFSFSHILGGGNSEADLLIRLGCFLNSLMLDVWCLIFMFFAFLIALDSWFKSVLLQNFLSTTLLPSFISGDNDFCLLERERISSRFSMEKLPNGPNPKMWASYSRFWSQIMGLLGIGSGSS